MTASINIYINIHKGSKQNGKRGLQKKVYEMRFVCHIFVSSKYFGCITLFILQNGLNGYKRWHKNMRLTCNILKCRSE